MIFQANVLSKAELLQVVSVLEQAPFRSGKATAGSAALEVKDNEQAHAGDADVIALSRRVKLALETHAEVRAWARPVRWSRLMFSRYRSGQQYGLHSDNAFVHDESGFPVRTDISFTLFLSEQDSYDGGALQIRDSTGERSFRPEAGSAVFYRTGQLHRVTPVARGTRLACVGWVQSLIRRADQRELLFDLEQIRNGSVTPAQGLGLDHAIGNLLRMWGED